LIDLLMITVTISEINSHRNWTHRARTDDAQTAIIRAMCRYFPKAQTFIPADTVSANMLFAAVNGISLRCGSYLETALAEWNALERKKYASDHYP
jgi:hypothetical protein